MKIFYQVNNLTPKGMVMGDMDSGKEDGTKFGDIFGELRNRESFRSMIGNSEFDNSLEQRIEEIESDIKLLKRHKHDEKSGDVMVRI